MGLIDNLNKRVKKLTIFDVKLAQWTAIFFALIIVKFFPQIMGINIWWFVTLGILSAIKPIYAFWIKK